MTLPETSGDPHPYPPLTCHLSLTFTPTTHPGQVPFPENCARCPVTTRLLKALPRSYQHAFFSALTPGTHIIKHHGPTNKKLSLIHI